MAATPSRTEPLCRNFARARVSCAPSVSCAPAACSAHLHVTRLGGRAAPRAVVIGDRRTPGARVKVGLRAARAAASGCVGRLSVDNVWGG
eukprot:359260-Chlamydomonas_euryale.AAC.8